MLKSIWGKKHMITSLIIKEIQNKTKNAKLEKAGNTYISKDVGAPHSQILLMEE